ncbi:hypothetical protein BDR07DRAFT_1394208, partial [Suillus spraguei]
MVQLYFDSFAITLVIIGILHHTTASATRTADATETRVQECLGMSSTVESIVPMPGLPRNQALHNLFFLAIH